MLNRLYMSLPKEALTKERFEMPLLDSIIQGQKTYVRNFAQVLKTINRDEKHIFKFLTKEIGTAAAVDTGKLVLNGKFTNQQVMTIFETYVKQYVLCPECNRPDTKFIDSHGIKQLKCDACGAVSSIKKV